MKKLLLLLVCLLALTLTSCQKTPDPPLEVTAVFPANGAASVPQNTALEISFSTPPGKADDYFSISPSLEGSFRYMDHALAFLPSGRDGNEWSYGTTYTVTLKAGLPAKEGKGTLAEDYSFSFTIQEEYGSFYEMEHRAETFLPGDYPVLDIRRDGKGDMDAVNPGEEFSVSVHRLENGERYFKELYRLLALDMESQVNTTGLPEVLSFTQGKAELFAGDSYSGDIVFPEPLPQGWYVATVTSSRQEQPPFQKLLQIQESAVYTQLHDGEAVLWFNSTKTGKPVSGAKLEAWKDPFASTGPDITVQGDGDGILVLDLPELDTEQQSDGWPRGQYQRTTIPVAITAPDGTVFYDVLRTYNFQRERSTSQDYYGFLYLDRTIYHQDDTVKFWGVARPRKNAPKLDQVDISVSFNWGDTPVQTLEVPVNAGGVFSGEFSYQNLRSGWLSVSAYPEGERPEPGSYSESVCQQGAEIAQYKNPIYTGSITTDKLYYQPEETIRVQVEMSLFDRTPAAGMKLKLSANGEPVTPVQTDSRGAASVTLPARVTRQDRTQWGWYPNSYYIESETDDPSDVNLSFLEYVYIFPTTVMMEAKEERQGEKSDLVITANHIDFDQIPGGGQLIQDYKTLRGKPAQADVTVDLHKVSYTRIEMAPYYDRYTKKSIPRCIYRRNDGVEKTFSRTLDEDGRLVLADILPPVEDELGYYYVTITTNTGGHQTSTLTLGDPWRISPSENSGHFHTFQVRGEGDVEEAEYYSYWGSTFRFGETVRYQVMDNGIPVEGGQVMTNYLQKTILEPPVVQGTQGEIPCTEEKLPNFTLCGAYFDGKRIYPIKPYSLAVEPESRQLDLQVLPEQEDYRPGDTAKVTLRLTGDGKPVSGANVCLGVVDESIFALSEQYINMGRALYGSVFYDYPDVYCSYIQHGANPYYGDGGKGGGGGGGGTIIRENFKDTAAFLTGVTGADGTVGFAVALPDNLTQWRLTAMALDQRAYWGQTKSSLYTTLPFRIDPILSNTFLTGDTIACTVRGFGKEINSNDLVEYTASIQGWEEPLEVTAQAPAGDITPLTFQKLPAGEYAITVTARCGEYSDGVKVPFTVRDSALLFPIHQTVDLSRGIEEEIIPLQYPVEVEIYHENQKSFLQAWGLLRRDTSGRGDAALAMESVKGIMTAFFGEGWQHPETDLSNIQVSLDDLDGKGYQGVRLFPYAEADLAASAWGAVAAPELLDDYQLWGYLDKAYTSAANDEDRAAALMGLAALDRLDDVQMAQLRTRAAASGLSTREAIYLTAGLSYLDQGAAQKLYAKQITPKLLEKMGGLYITEDTAYQTVDSTAGAMACAILTGAADDAGKMMAYLAANCTTPYGTLLGPCQLQSALYLQRFQLKDSDLPQVSYTLGGKRETVTLPRNGCLRFALNKEEWAAFAPKAEGSGAIASITYTGTPDQLGINQSPRITVTKTMDTPEDQKRLGGETTVTVKVELAQNVPYGSYRLVEWVPSNMRLRKVKRNTRDGFSWRQDEQLLTVDFHYSKASQRTFTFQYTATSVLDTECTLERTYVYNIDTMESGRTEKGEFLPSDYYYLGVGYLFRKE